MARVGSLFQREHNICIYSYFYDSPQNPIRIIAFWEITFVKKKRVERTTNVDGKKYRICVQFGAFAVSSDHDRFIFFIVKISFVSFIYIYFSISSFGVVWLFIHALGSVERRAHSQFVRSPLHGFALAQTENIAKWSVHFKWVQFSVESTYKLENHVITHLQLQYLWIAYTSCDWATVFVYLCTTSNFPWIKMRS